MRKFISLACITVFLISCGGNKKVVTTSSNTKRTTSRQTAVTKIERNTREIVKKVNQCFPSTSVLGGAQGF